MYRDELHMMAWGPDEARLHAGLHLLLLHQTAGSLVAAESFMTWQPELDKGFMQYWNEIQEGRLLVLLGAVSHRCLVR